MKWLNIAKTVNAKRQEAAMSHSEWALRVTTSSSECVCENANEDYFTAGKYFEYSTIFPGFAHEFTIYKI